MAIADMFLKMQGVTGEAGDAEHKGEIEVVGWSWGMQASTSAAQGRQGGKASLSELHITKRVDQASPTLMNFLRSHKLVSEAKLTVRKAGQTPLEYFKIELWQVRITALETQSEGTDLIERLRLGFSRVKVSYTPQGSHGGGGGGDNVFDADAHAGT